MRIQSFCLFKMSQTPRKWLFFFFSFFHSWAQLFFLFKLFRMEWVHPNVREGEAIIIIFLSLRVGHVFRETNKCANLLAKRDCSWVENFVMFDTSPFDDLNVLLEADRNELYYYRHVANTLAFVTFL